MNNPQIIYLLASEFKEVIHQLEQEDFLLAFREGIVFELDLCEDAEDPSTSIFHAEPLQAFNLSTPWKVTYDKTFTQIELPTVH